MLLITVSMTVMTVLHFAEVVHIPHESRLYLVASHPLIRRNNFTHFQVCARISLQGFQWLLLACSAPTEVSLEVSVQNHQGTPLALSGSQESPLLYPLIPN
jgi:hypothetical protein